MKKISEMGFMGYSGYSLKKNSNGWRVFYVYTYEGVVGDMMTSLCTLDIDEEMSSLVKKRDFNYIESKDIISIYEKYFKK